MINTKYYWCCIRKSDIKCGACAKTIRNGTNHHLLTTNDVDHGHEPEQDSVMVLEVRRSLKKKAADSLDRPCQIIQKCKSSVPRNQAIYLPSDDAMRMIIHRASPSKSTKIAA